MSDALMSRAGYVAMRLAQRVLDLDEGDRIPRFDDLAQELDCGKGTVQAAFDILRESGGLTLRARGRLGTFVDHVDHTVLWQLAGRRSVSIAMPLPYSRRYEGLASGLQLSFGNAGIPLTLMFMRGAVARLRALTEERADLVLMSALAAQDDPELEIVHNYGPGSYVASHCLVVAQGHDPRSPDLRVGVDDSSLDQRRLVQRVFGDLPPARRVPLSYNQLDAAFREGRIDATVWNADEIRTHITAPIDITPVSLPADAANTQAVIVRLRHGQPVTSGVRAALTDPAVTDQADAVVDGRATPSY
jgi:hypothetical protein